MARDVDRLAAIDAKLTVILALAVPAYADNVRGRSIDKLLTDAGLSTTEAATILGKTERAVQLALQRERQRKKRRPG